MLLHCLCSNGIVVNSSAWQAKRLVGQFQRGPPWGCVSRASSIKLCQIKHGGLLAVGTPYGTDQLKVACFL